VREFFFACLFSTGVQTILAFLSPLRNVQINLEVKRGDFQQIGANLGLLLQMSAKQ
jgi:hypothetical protein